MAHINFQTITNLSSATFVSNLLLLTEVSKMFLSKPVKSWLCKHNMKLGSRSQHQKPIISIPEFPASYWYRFVANLLLLSGVRKLVSTQKSANVYARLIFSYSLP